MVQAQFGKNRRTFIGRFLCSEHHCTIKKFENMYKVGQCENVIFMYVGEVIFWGWVGGNWKGI